MGPVYIVIKDGLGNQMFQAALGVALGRRGVEVRYLIDSYDDESFGRTFMLDRFPNLELHRADRAETANLSVIGSVGLTAPALMERLKENQAVVLDGWWQDENFFLGQHAAVREAFKLAPDAKLAELGSQLQAEGAIGAHVRRSDYGHLGLAKASYYRDAIAEIRTERGPRRVVFFTDEPNFCWHTFNALLDMALSRGNLDNPLADFYLLSCCAHFVIANSSFSWWAAWLGRNAQSVIYAPSPWIVGTAMNPVPPDWRRTPDALIHP